MTTSDRPDLVVLGGDTNALSAARRLGPTGVAVTVLHDGRGSRAIRRSRYIRDFVATPRGTPPESNWDRWLTTAPDGAVLLPGSDEGLQYLATRYDDLQERGLRPIELDPSAVLDLLSKERTHDIAVAAGVPVPWATRVSSLADARAAAQRAGYPFALKPIHSHEYARAFSGESAGKGAIVHDDAELVAAYERIEARGTAVLATELVPGPDDAFCSYYTFLDSDGRPLAHLTKSKLRQYPVRFGLGTYHRTEWHAHAVELGLRMFAEAGVRGIANVEFKRDARDGELKLIECNLRLTGPDELLQRAGVDLVTLAYDRARGHRGQPAVAPSPDGFRVGLYEWLPGNDLRALSEYRRRGEMTVPGWLRTLSPRIRGPVFRLRDPMPFLGSVGGVAVGGLRRRLPRLRGR